MNAQQRAAGGGCLVLLVTVPILVVLRGIVLAQLWAWFVAETFHVYSVSVAEACGIALAYSILSGDAARAASDATKQHAAIDFASPRARMTSAFRHVYDNAFGTAVGALVMGWVVHQFV